MTTGWMGTVYTHEEVQLRIREPAADSTIYLWCTCTATDTTAYSSAHLCAAPTSAQTRYKHCLFVRLLQINHRSLVAVFVITLRPWRNTASNSGHSRQLVGTIYYSHRHYGPVAHFVRVPIAGHSCSIVPLYMRYSPRTRKTRKDHILSHFR